MRKKGIALTLILLAVMICISGCAAAEPPLAVSELSDWQADNLEKLCLVWGFVKYYHPLPASGGVDMDQELFKLLPPMLKTGDAAEVNAILYAWADGLERPEITIDAKTQEAIDYAAGLKVAEEADLSWIEKDYLGADLSAFLIGLSETPVISNDKAYVTYSASGIPQFENEHKYNEMRGSDKSYQNDNFRLLALFRLWNTIQYYFPYKSILDVEWKTLLPEYISRMVEGDDDSSYVLTLYALTSHLHDAHVMLDGYSYRTLFGLQAWPVSFRIVDGQIITTESVTDAKDPEQKLLAGDIILAMDGEDIDEVIDDRLQYISVPDKQRSGPILKYFLFRNNQNSIDLTVVRDGKEITVTLTSGTVSANSTTNTYTSHELLEGNIGLINPAAATIISIPFMMEEFKNTDGLIIDLRQSTNTSMFYILAGEYLFSEKTVFAQTSHCNSYAPGCFIYSQPMTVGRAVLTNNPGLYYYRNPVIILMDENTFSNAEFTIMALRQAPNVTVIGTNSIGADGDYTLLPLPGAIHFGFTSLGVFYPDYSPTQRIGIAPDIYVPYTVEGIKEGRDELMEAAIGLIRGP